MNEQRELLEDGISSCQRHLEIVEQATSKAKEIDQLLSEITAVKEEDMETVETKTQVLAILVVLQFYIILRSIQIPYVQANDCL